MSVNDASIRAGCQMEIENVSLETRHMELIEMLNDMPCQDGTHSSNTDDATCTNLNMCVETEANEEIEILLHSLVNPELNTCVGISTREEEIGRMTDTSVRADCREETSIRNEQMSQDESLHSGCQLNVEEAIMPNIKADYQEQIENVTFEIPWDVSIDVSTSSKSLTETVCHQSDSSGFFQEVGKDSDIVEKRHIWLPVTIVKPAAPIQYSELSTIAAELSGSYVRPSEPILTDGTSEPIPTDRTDDDFEPILTDGTDDDLVPALDQLAALLGEPPRKKTVWDQFDLITKNLPFAQHLRENDMIKSAGAGAMLDKTILHGCKRNTQKKTATKNVRFALPGKPHHLPSRYCTGDSVRKGTARTMTVGRRLNFEIKQPYEIPVRGKCVPSSKSVPNNIGNIIDSTYIGNNNMKTKVSECIRTQNRNTNPKKKFTSQLNISSTSPTCSLGSGNSIEGGAKAAPQQRIKSCDPCSYKTTLNPGLQTPMEVWQQYPTLQPRLVPAGYSCGQFGSCQARVDIDLTLDSL